MTEKAKRRLSDFDFKQEGAHLALCSKSQGAANGHNKALIMKGNNFSPEFIQKAQQVQVTMELPDFLRKFFDLWYEDAEILARLMGYVPKEEEVYEDYIDEKVKSFQILKSLHSAESLPAALAKLTEVDYLDILNDQVVLEKAMNELAIERDKRSKADASTSVENKVEPSGSKVIKNKEMQMSQPEMVEKSALTNVEKALEDNKVALQKAQELIAKYEAAEKEAIVKSKTDAITAVVKDEKQVAVLLKAALALESQEDFDSFVAVLKAQQELVEKAGLFQEQGASGQAAEEKNDEDRVAAILKAQFSQNK